MAKKKIEPTFMTAPKKSFDTKEIKRLYAKFDQWQLAFYESIQDHIVTCVDSVAGSGKTSIATLAGLQMLDNGDVDKIIYIRVPSSRSLSQGFLPGSAIEKQAILMTAMYNALEELGIQNIDTLIDDGKLVLTSDIGLRGVNLKNACVILDEAQEMDVNTLQLILTRCHDSCKIIICGHSAQRDNVKQKLICGMTGFQLFSIHLAKKNFGNCCNLEINYRGKLSQWADQIQDTIDEIIEGKICL